MTVIKLIGFNKLTWWIHLPVGLVIAWFCYENPVVACLIAGLFVVYEVRESMKINDKDYEDIKGAGFGLAMLGAILTIFY